MTMTKSELYNKISTDTGMSKKEVGAFFDYFADMAINETKKNGEFAIPGIGKLLKIKRAARMGRNPATGEEIKIAAKTVAKFRVAKPVKDALLGK